MPKVNGVDTSSISKVNGILKANISKLNGISGLFDASPTPTPTNTPTPSITPTRTVTPTVTPSITPSITPTRTVTPTVTPSITPSITPTRTVTPSVTPSITPSVTPSISVSPTRTPTVTPSVTPSISVSPTRTPTVTPTRTPTVTPTVTPSPSAAACNDVNATYGSTGQEFTYCPQNVTVSLNGTNLSNATTVFAFGYGCDPNFLAPDGYYGDGSGNYEWSGGVLTPNPTIVFVTCNTVNLYTAPMANDICNCIAPNIPFGLDSTPLTSASAIYTDCCTANLAGPGWYSENCGTGSIAREWDGTAFIGAPYTCP
jgi:hypothetical protein